MLHPVLSAIKRRRRKADNNMDNSQGLSHREAVLAVLLVFDKSVQAKLDFSYHSHARL